MTSQEFNTMETPRAYAEQVLNRSQTALQEAVAITAPDTPEADPLEIFAAPGEVRAEDAGLDLDDRQVADLRTTVAELGFGRQEDRTLSEQGVFGAMVVIEGGQPHKMAAEVQTLLHDDRAQPSAILFAASPNRRIAADSPEAASAYRQTGKNGATEYDVARDIAMQLPGFTADEPRDLLLSYDINNEFTLGQEESGQFIRIGVIDDTPVILLRVDREDYQDEAGNAKYRKQPGTYDLLKIVSDFAQDSGNDQSPVALVTSATYEASRNVDAARVGLETGRVTAIAAYGTQRLSVVKGESMPSPAPINQLPGELHKLAQQFLKLEDILQIRS